jgi:transcriptional regulator with XRE-family HTH domain
MSDGSGDPNFDVGGFAQRVREAMFPEKITAFATRIGMPQATVSKILSGTAVGGPRLDIAARIAEGLGCSLDWLVYGRGDGESAQNLVRIPRFDAQLAAGAGAWNDGRLKVEDVPFTQAFLREQLGRLTAASLAVLTARGDSMEPTIADRAWVIIDEAEQEPFDAVFAFVLAGEARVKRFRRLTDGLMLISDNDAYPPEVVKGDELSKLQVIGRVLSVVQRV